MWYGIVYKDEQEVELALETLMKKDLIAQIHPISLATVPGQAFPGLAFPQELRKNILRALKLKDGPSTATSDPNLRLILTEPVTVLGQPGDQNEAIEEVLRVYAPEFGGLRLLATNPHGNESSPGRERRIFHVRFYSAPRKLSKERTLARAFGFALPLGMRDGLPPSGLGTPLRAPEGVVAELCGNTLYILFDLPHNPDGELPCNLLARILELVLELRASTEGDVEEQYVQLALRRHRLRLVALLGRQKALTQKIKAAEQTIAQAQRELADAKYAIQQLDQEDAEKIARQEFQNLLSLPHVEQVEIQGGYLRVYTDEIYLQYAGKTYPLGTYQVKIPLDRGLSLAIVNQTPKRMDKTLFHHPHIRGNGTQICLGNFAPVTQLIAEQQWALIAQMMIEFLHYVNADHPSYIKILQACWRPLAKPRPCSCQAARRS